MKGDYEGQMMFGDCLGLNSPDNCLTSMEKSRKTLHRGNLSQTELA